MKWLALAVAFYLFFVAPSGSSATLPQAPHKTTLTKPATPNTSTIPMGDWKTGFYVDEVRDKTMKGFVSMTTAGSFSIGATENAALTVEMYVDGGSRDPWFRFYEYARSHPVKGVYSNAMNTVKCLMTTEKMEPFTAHFNQRKGSDYFWLDDRDQSKLRNAVVEESSVNALCRHAAYPSIKYKFTMDFSHFGNAMAKAEGNIAGA